MNYIHAFGAFLFVIYTAGFAVKFLELAMNKGKMNFTATVIMAGIGAALLAL